MNTSAYLSRLGLSNSDVENSVTFLNKLQYAHVTTIPYENLDILDGIPISLDPEVMFEKIVTHHRGGYCFEVNGLLSALLLELGFDVKNHLARFLRGENTIPVRRHRVLTVTCTDGRYLCDVGIGQTAPRHPLKMEAGLVQEQFGEIYKMEWDDFHGWIVYDLHDGEWRKFYSFTEDAQLDVDFIMPSFYCEKHPNVPFHKDVMVAIKTADGRRALNGRDYKEFVGDTLSYIEEELSDERRISLLKEKFGITWH